MGSRRNGTNAGWVHYWSDRSIHGCGTRGAVGTPGMEIAQADTRMHVDTGRWIGTPGMDHVHVPHCFIPALGLKNRDTYIQRFSVISVIDCKSVFDFVTKPGAPTGIDDKRCAIDMATIRGCLKRIGVALRWGPTGLMLGDALTKDKAEAADLSKTCVRASACQLADESSTLKRAREGREARSSPNADGRSRGHRRRTADENVPGRTHRRATDRVPNDSCRGLHAGELPSQDRVVQPSDEARESKSDVQLVVNTGNIQVKTVASLEDRVLRLLVDLESDNVKWMRGELHIDKKNPYSPAIRPFRGRLTTRSNTNSQVPDSHERRLLRWQIVQGRCWKTSLIVTRIRLAFMEQRWRGLDKIGKTPTVTAFRANCLSLFCSLFVRSCQYS